MIQKFEKIAAAFKEAGVVKQCTAVYGKKVYCSFWEESVLQFLGRKCTAVSEKKVYYSFWEESVLQFLLGRKCTPVSGKKVYCNFRKESVLQFLERKCTAGDWLLSTASYVRITSTPLNWCSLDG